ncbi:helicase-like protein [short-finned eel virus]|uniref:Helicase-like protein n=1 Tax=short-finned eel virus TaxID=2848076 RepID=A0A192GQ92_FRG3V|nr:helicase-like protein [Short-finned eel ranavirus]ANK58088.1 helicase-like protein [Short-finned eel ranavirus]
MAKLLRLDAIEGDMPGAGEADLFALAPGGKAYVPFAWGSRVLGGKPPPAHGSARERGSVSPRPHQKGVLKEAWGHVTSKGHCMLKCPPGFGKTFMALELWRRLGMPALVLTNRRVLVTQWRDSATRFLPDSRVFTSGAPPPNALPRDLYVTGPASLRNRRIKAKDSPATFLLIVDEAHQLTSPVSCRVLLSVRPSHLLGLSATPMRYDDYHAALGAFFGGEDNMVDRADPRPHEVEILSTGVHVEPEFSKITGKMDWNSVIKAQSENPERDAALADRMLLRPDVKWLVLCKRVDHVKRMAETLSSRSGKKVDVLHGSKDEWDREAWCVVGTYSKVGTGFDACERTGLCLAADVDRYFEQCLGRLRADGGTVLDPVDDLGVLKKHSKNREAVYIAAGCTIKKTKCDASRPSQSTPTPTGSSRPAPRTRRPRR